MKDNISLNKISWHSIDENGYINIYLKNKEAIYIYMEIGDEKRCYIGSSLQLVNRLTSHRYSTRNLGQINSNGSPVFYNSVLKYGWKYFQLGVLEFVDLSNITDIKEKKAILLEREQYYLNKINPSLNTCKTAGSPLGIKRNFSFCINVSKAKRGKKNTRSTINLNTAYKNITSETRSKLSSRAKGVTVKIYNKSNNLISQFPSMASAAKHFGVSYNTISRIQKTGISYDDYTYKFEVITGYPLIVNKEKNTITEYHSISEAAKCICVSRETISKYINTDKLLKDTYLITKNK